MGQFINISGLNPFKPLLFFILSPLCKLSNQLESINVNIYIEIKRSKQLGSINRQIGFIISNKDSQFNIYQNMILHNKNYSLHFEFLINSN